ncbi:hypothetical protein AAZV13_18G079100 [Glycine max]
MCYHASVYISKPMTPTLNPSHLLFILHEDSFTETTTTTSPSHSLTTPRTPSLHPSPFAYVPTNKVVFTNPKDVVGPHWYNPMQIPVCQEETAFPLSPSVIHLCFSLMSVSITHKQI